MREKRFVAVPLIGIALLLITLLGFAGTAPPREPDTGPPPVTTEAPASASPTNAADAADNGLIFEASPRVRRIGAGIGEAPAVPGSFHFDLGVPLESVSRAYLSYELAGVPHWTATVRSINGLPVQGGFGSIPASGMALQVEEINPHWLRGGNNEVLFLPVGGGELPPIGVAKVEEGSAPAGEPVPYTVRNLRLVVFTHGSHSTAPRLRITYPVHGESEADGAFVRGFVDPSGTAAGPAELFAGDSHVPGAVRPADGTFAVFVPRTSPEGEAWDVPVEVVYPDGTRLRQTVHLRGKKPGEEDGDKDGEKGEKTEKAEADAKTGEAKVLALGGARLEVPAGALSGPVKLSMRRLAAGEVPALDSGMTNVTALKGGLRMGPHGLKFKKPVHLTVPFDPALLPKGMTEADVHTYFLDEAAGRWVALPRSPEKAAGTAVVSLTDHFTDFVNATLSTPDEPSGSNLSSNSLQDLAKADPASQIVQIAPPEAGPTGDAMLDFPLVVPPGRHGLAPALAVSYQSSGGDGWLGMGWDLRLPSIEVSTLFGVPRYDGAKESESYLIDGEQLAPLANPNQDRTADRGYVRRSEGSFERIVRRGSAPANYSWEVTDKSGTRHLFGLSPQSRLRDPISGNTFRWYLERTIDLHGNTVDYSYTTDAGDVGGSGEPWVQVYPAAIAYTGSNGAGAFYRVIFTLDDGNQRADRLSSGRPGFKTVTRRRLAAVDVLAGGALVRRYLFNYREGDFRKSLLGSIAATGEDGTTALYRHGFDYIPMAAQGDGYAGFGAPQPWSGMGGGGDATASSHSGGGAHGFVGAGPPDCYPHGGAQFGGGGSDTTQQVSFVDVNGDGLPDRLDQGGGVDLNRYDPAADIAGTAPGNFVSTRFSGVDSLGHTSEWNLDVGLGLHNELGIPISLDTNWIWSHSNDDHAVLDVNGDGRPDLVSTAGGFGVRINDGSSFTGRSNWGGFGGEGLSLTPAGESSEVLGSFPLADALRQLRLPFAGHVFVNGAVQKKVAGGDGVTASIYQGGNRVWSHRFAADETAGCLPGPGDSCSGGLGLDVVAGQSLYFLADSVRETSADALLWAPIVVYDGGDPQALEPWGARAFVFDAGADFSLAGYRGAAWSAPAAGTVRVVGAFVKQATADDVTVTVSRGHGGSEDAPFYSRTFGAAEVGSFDEIPTLAVQGGDVLFLRVASDTPINPARVSWTPSVTFEGDTVPPSLPDTIRTQTARVAIAAPSVAPLGQPTQSWPADGNNTVTVSWLPATGNRVVLYAQGVDRLIEKRELTGLAGFSLNAPAAAGEPLFFTLLVDRPEDAGILRINGGSIPVNVRLRDDGTPASVLSGGYHGWFYGDWNGNSPFDPSALTTPDANSSPSFTPGLPSWEGTDGLAAPVWKGSGFDLYLAGEGAKPSRRGANAAGLLDQSAGTPGGGLSILRKTSTRTEGVSGGAIAGVGLSRGSSETELDLLDMNGDGYPDQVSSSGVRFSNGRDGFGPLQGFGGLDSVVRQIDDASASTSIGLGVNYVKKDGGGMASAVLSSLPSGGSTVALSQVKSDLIDVNGDGLPDRVSMNPGSGAMTVQLNLGYRFGAPEVWALPSWNNGGSGRCQDVIDSLSSALGGLSSLDTLDGFNFTRSSAVHVGGSFGPFGASVVSTLARTLVEMTDVNGDGLPDRVSKDQGEDFFRVQLNLGDRWDTERRWYAPGWSTSLGDGYNPLGIFSCLDAVSFTGNVETEGSVGAPICIPLIPPIPVVGLQIEISGQVFDGRGGMQLFLQDLDGDGLADHVLKKSGDSNVYVKRNQAERVNLLSAVHRPLGSTIELTYERRGNTPDMPSSQWVLASSTVRDGRGNAYTTSNQYGNDAVYDRAERESYGFPHLKTILPDGSTVEHWFDNHDFYSRYLPLKTAVADATGNLFQAETTAYTEVPLGSQASFPAKVQETTLFYEGSATAGKSTSQTWQYDGLGNVVAMTDSGDDGPADDVNATVAYTADTNNWVFKPQLVEARDGGGNLLRRSAATYAAAGELTRLEKTLSGGRDPLTGAPYSGSKNAVWTFAYDDAGNLVSAVEPSGFTATSTYDPQTRTYPAQVRDSFGYVTTYAYELKYGAPASTTDENGNTLRRAYDPFGRLLRVVGPDDSDASPALAFEYHPVAGISWAAVHQKDVTRPDPIDSATFVDSLERVLQTKEDAELDLGTGTSTRTGMRVSGRIAFDAKGRVASQGQPVFDSGPASQFVDMPAKNPTILSYDALDRVREVRFPQGVSTRIDYGFGTLDGVSRLLTTRTDPNNRATRFYRDVREKVRGVEQTSPAGRGAPLITRYAYDALSEITSVTDAKGNVTRLEWDTLGRNVVLDNPDAGRTENRYDPAGNLGARITANLAAAGKQIRYSYTFGRLSRIDYPSSPAVVYTYGAPGAAANGANRIVTVTDESGTEQRSYDKYGNVVTAVKTIISLNGSNPKGPYTSRFQYDSFGRLLSLTYPDGEQLTYGFDAGGRVKTATGTLRKARYDYLRHTGYDEFGERVRLVYGNGVETRYAFDPQSRFLTQLRCIAPARDLQNLAYQYDPAGTVLGIQNNVAVSAVPSLYGGPTALSFQYDALSQLTGATGSYRQAQGKTSSYSLTMAYDEVGDVVAKNQLHQTAPFGGTPTTQTKTSYNWAYTYGGPQPHAPTRIGDRTFHYDLNGNQTGWDSDGGTRRTTTWDEENRPLSVTDNQATPTRFFYNAGGVRTNKLGLHGETLYISRWFSLRNGGTVSKHVFADDLRVATKVTTTAEFLFFYQPDHLGSAHFITDEQGTAYAHLEYFPSGEIWVDEHSDTLNLPFLFSGKEIDDETGLSYFGARYYEPRQGQWISADPILDGMLGVSARPDLSSRPFFLKGHVYRYVANSPLNHVDPTGLMFGAMRAKQAAVAPPAVDQHELMLTGLHALGVGNVARLRNAYRAAKAGGNEAFIQGYRYQIEKTAELHIGNVNGGVAEVEFAYTPGRRADIRFNDGSLGEIKRTANWGAAWEQFQGELSAYAQANRDLHIFTHQDLPVEIGAMVQHFRSGTQRNWSLNGAAVEGDFMGFAMGNQNPRDWYQGVQDQLAAMAAMTLD